ncbi:hypothetical protein HOY80DRAFT_999553 [Tuber brumale]|nr:hypothetical protein HOY80DRAFT_999553 [Tuber brumale]
MEFTGGVDVEPLVMEEEVAVVVEKRIVVRLPVAVVESVAEAVVAEDVAIVEEVAKGKEVAVMAEGVDDAVSSWEEDWTVVRKKVREREEVRRRKKIEDERDAVRKRINVWHSGMVLVDNAPLGPRGV